MADSTVTRVFYDDACAFCTRQVRRLARLDRAGRFRWVPRTSAEANALAARLPPGALDTAMHCLTPDGRILSGAWCFRHLAMRLPWLALGAWVLWLPGAMPVAAAVYAWVSRNRYRLGARGPGACPGACAPRDVTSTSCAKAGRT